MDFLKQTLNILIDLFITLLFLRVVLSWMVQERGPLMNFLIQATEPALKPIRDLLPRLGPLDLSPIVLFIALDLLRTLINAYL
jgi:YggT family protein